MSANDTIVIKQTTHKPPSIVFNFPDITTADCSRITPNRIHFERCHQYCTACLQLSAQTTISTGSRHVSKLKRHELHTIEGLLSTATGPPEHCYGSVVQRLCKGRAARAVEDLKPERFKAEYHRHNAAVSQFPHRKY